MTGSEKPKRKHWSYSLKSTAVEAVSNPKQVKPRHVYLHDHRARDEVDEYMDSLREQA